MRKSWNPIIGALVLGVGLSACSEPESNLRTAPEYLASAQILVDAGEFREAVSYLDTALMVDSTFAEAWYQRGECFHAQDSCDGALPDYTKAIRLGGPRSVWVRNQAICLLSQNKVEEALANYQLLFEADSVALPDYYFYASALLETGQMDTAYNVIMMGLKLDNQGPYFEKFMSFVNEEFEEDYLRARFYEESGMRVEYTLVDSVRNGPWSSYLEDGTLSETGNYVNGIKEGEEVVYYPSGKVQSTTFYVAGKMDGIRTTWYEEGERWSEVSYEADRRQGLARSWYQNGNLRIEENYLNGRKDGHSTHWFLDGKLAERLPYKFGALDGEGVVWDSEAETYVEVAYSDDVLLHDKVLPENEWP